MTHSSASDLTIRHANDAEEISRMHMPNTNNAWTLAEVHRLPDDGNRYELVNGELFVTPAPLPRHERILVRLRQLIDPYVSDNSLGVIQTRGVIQVRGSEVEPDLLVRDDSPTINDWAEAPTPILVVEVLSDSTRRRVRVQKRDWYLDVGIPEYWIIDPDTRTVVVVRPRVSDETHADRITWHPTAAKQPFELLVANLFG